VVAVLVGGAGARWWWRGCSGWTAGRCGWRRCRALADLVGLAEAVGDGVADPDVAGAPVGGVDGDVASETTCWSCRVTMGSATARATSATTRGTVTRTEPGILGFKRSSGGRVSAAPV
jgi:hypothetical protein